MNNQESPTVDSFFFNWREKNLGTPISDEEENEILASFSKKNAKANNDMFDRFLESEFSDKYV